MNIFKKVTGGLIASVLALVLVGSPAFAVSTVDIYNAVPNPLPPNVASLGYEATSTTQFGDSIQLGGTNRGLNSVTVTMSNWALYSDYATNPTYADNNVSWTHPITVNIYSDQLGSNGVPNTLLATKTQDVTIPWRPVADTTCSNGTAWRATDGLCYNGIAFNATFDFSNLNVTLPNNVIVGVAYNTADYGVAPIHAAGPYNSLNVGIPTNQSVTVGTDVDTDAVFWNTSHAPFYTDGGVAGVGIFRQDTNWTPNGTMAVKITANIPMPTDKDQCKKDGWQTFGDTFKNQGDCVSFVAAHGKNQ